MLHAESASEATSEPQGARWKAGNVANATAPKSEEYYHLGPSGSQGAACGGLVVARK